MKYYGIKAPKTDNEESYIWWISSDPFKSWDMFFTHPNRSGEKIPFRLCLAEAKRAYRGNRL